MNVDAAGNMVAFRTGLIAAAVSLSMQDSEAHEAVKRQILQQAIDAGLSSGLSSRVIDELIAGAERDAAVDDPAGHA